jgi:uncharacterized repeat protein (TIGR03803 family)
MFVILLALTINLQAQTFTVLYSFLGPPEGGGDLALPSVVPTLDPAGNLHGTTASGGKGRGGVWKIDTTGAYSFISTGGNASGPSSQLIVDGKGNLYGTAGGGGDLTCNAPYGCGQVFRVSPRGKWTVWYNFTGSSEFPLGKLAIDRHLGILYGTTGGCNSNSTHCGRVFDLPKRFQHVVLHTFQYRAGDPSGLVRDAAGNLYGTTTDGGDLTCDCGEVFKITTIIKVRKSCCMNSTVAAMTERTHQVQQL